MSSLQIEGTLIFIGESRSQKPYVCVMYLLVALLLCRVKLNDISQLKPLIGKARLARCRSRFVVPVISFKGKVGFKSLPSFLNHITSIANNTMIVICTFYTSVF